MTRTLQTVWNAVPVIVRAPISAFLVLLAGQLTQMGILGNAKIYPQIPWALPATLLLLVPFWLWFTGRGIPASTGAWRGHVTRRGVMTAAVRRAAIAPVVCSVISLVSLRLLLPSMLPVDPPAIALDLSGYPPVVIASIVLSIAIAAGVTEEVAFRGYLQKQLEDTYGLAPAIVVTGFAFWLAHADKVTVTHLPFHLTTSLFAGLLVFLTRSLWPAIFAHIAGDVVLQPVYFSHQPEFVWTTLNARPLWAEAGATTTFEKLQIVWSAIEPSQLVVQGPHQTIAVLAWIFVASAALTTMTLARLASVRTATEAAARTKLRPDGAI